MSIEDLRAHAYKQIDRVLENCTGDEGCGVTELRVDRNHGTDEPRPGPDYVETYGVESEVRCTLLFAASRTVQTGWRQKTPQEIHDEVEAASWGGAE